LILLDTLGLWMIDKQSLIARANHDATIRQLQDVGHIQPFPVFLGIGFKRTHPTSVGIDDINASVKVANPDIIVLVHHQTGQHIAAEFPLLHILSVAFEAVFGIQCQQAKAIGALKRYPSGAFTIFNNGNTARHQIRRDSTFKRIVQATGWPIKNINTIQTA